MFVCVCVMQEQQQALLYQLMQQQQQQQHDLQQLSSAQLPINNLLPAAQGAITANPFLALHTDNSNQKAVVSNVTHSEEPHVICIIDIFISTLG